ncbi:hypothetical protein SAMN02745157_1447 [Kaistia soli DSM 19436]|uniref:Uncharacterized protein n=1 Tax=Kaistia soli DSM 19436 TaxID=1122133 RepID=A0A1M4Y7Q7_9HYPH|nr:hypothetical protein [Kaistia soli]SHF01710.1 hypothetical protein SAMN02745157_1447 [Kaistia soli DSM 19436]
MTRAADIKVVSLAGDDGKRRSVAERICGNCGARGHVPSRGATGRGMPPEAINRMFRAKGWELGIAAFSERCPDCVAAAKISETMEEPAMPEIKSPNSIAAIAALPATAPRSITPDDRRLIFVKLGDVYDDGAGGYVVGWTDKRVSQDLGCPLAWVSEVREQMFGPLKANPEILALLEECRRILDKAEERFMAAQRQHNETVLAISAADKRLSAEGARVVDVFRGITEDMDRTRAKLRKIEQAVLP